MEFAAALGRLLLDPAPEPSPDLAALDSFEALLR